MTAKNLSVQIYNSSFSGYGVNGNGGALLLLASDMTNFIIRNSSFVNTAAFGAYNGGAIHLECLRSIIKIDDCVFKHNKAGSGGAVCIHVVRSMSKIVENSTQEGEHSQPKSLISPLLNVDIIDCIFKSTMSTSVGHASPGGAVSIIGPTMSVRLLNSTFVDCSAVAYGGALYMASMFQAAERIVLYVDSSHFVGCRCLNYGGAVYVIFSTRVNVTIKKTKFELSSSDGPGGALTFINDYSSIDVSKENDYVTGSEKVIAIEDSSFLNSSSSVAAGGAIYISFSTTEYNLTIVNTNFTNNSAKAGGGAVSVMDRTNGGSQRTSRKFITIESSRFVNSTTLKEAEGGALLLSMPPDELEEPGCIKEGRPEKFPEWDYNSKLLFKDTTFQDNTARIGGAVYLQNGKTIFQHCFFVDNFALALGGGIYAAEGSTSVVIRDSFFLQSKPEQTRNLKTFAKSSFLHTEATGPLVVKNTTLNATRNTVGNSLVFIAKGGSVDFGENNLTVLYCPAGGEMHFLNFSNTITTRTKDSSCTVRVTGLDYSCLPCPGGLYSLQRGQMHGKYLKSGFECLLCPFGANCTKNIVAIPNFWGFEVSKYPPTLEFTICPTGYCRPNEQQLETPGYNGCQGNRSDVLCGQCKTGFTETLYSTQCRSINECNDYWFWPVTVLYLLIMAVYLTFKPPILSWIIRQILWFKAPKLATSQEPDFDRGYLKIAFYFYQAANLLLVSSSHSKYLLQAYFVGPIVGLFNFQQKLASSSGFICPFAGFTVVTKYLFSTFHVFGALLMVLLLYGFHFGFRKIRSNDSPHAGPYVGGILQILLLGYAVLGSVSFDLLRCVPIGTERRLFYDGNVVCLQRWQYVCIAFAVTFVVPFAFVLFWGAMKLHREVLSVKRFMFACFFPLPFLVQWTFTALVANSNDVTFSSSLTASVEKVLYDPFKRPIDGKGGSLSWESVLIGRRLILIIVKAAVSDPFSRVMLMTFFSFLVLVHHLAKQPFRDSKANAVETISLLSLIVLGMINAFPAAFISLAVSSTGPFTGWLNVCSWIEVLILGFVPAVCVLFVVVFLISQICRLLFLVGRFLGFCFGFCRSISCCVYRNEETPLLAPVA